MSNRYSNPHFFIDLITINRLEHCFLGLQAGRLLLWTEWNDALIVVNPSGIILSTLTACIVGSL